MFDEALHAYLEFLERAQGLSPSSLYVHRRHATAFVRDVRRHACRRWQDLAPRHIDGFIRRHAAQFNRAYRTHVLRVLRRFLAYLRFRGWIDRPMDNLVIPTRTYEQERLPRFLTRDQVRRLLGVIDASRAAGRRDLAMIVLLVSTGLRARELLDLRIDDVDWRGRLLRVCATKTRSSRLVPVPVPAYRRLVDYVRRDRPRDLRSRRLFASHGPNRGASLSQNTLNRQLRTHLAKAGLSLRSSCHGLRHTYAQHLLEQGAGYPTLQALLGHRSLVTTGFYARVNLRQLREVANTYAEDL